MYETGGGTWERTRFVFLPCLMKQTLGQLCRILPLGSFCLQKIMQVNSLCALRGRNPGLFEEAVKAVTQKVSEHEMTPGDLSCFC